MRFPAATFRRRWRWLPKIFSGMFPAADRGHAEVLGFFARFMELSNGTFRMRVDDVLAAGDRVVVLCTVSAERGGRSWSSQEVHVWTLKDGKATVFWEYQGDQQTEDEFWSSKE